MEVGRHDAMLTGDAETEIRRIPPSSCLARGLRRGHRFEHEGAVATQSCLREMLPGLSLLERWQVAMLGRLPRMKPHYSSNANRLSTCGGTNRMGAF